MVYLGTTSPRSYTDPRGLFDYVSLSTDALSRVGRFALFVSSPGAGALVREAAPPAH